MNLKKWVYTLLVGDDIPQVNDLLVTIGEKGVGKVVQIKSITKVKHKVVKPEQSYKIEVLELPFLKEFAEYELFEEDGVIGAYVWVKGNPAWPVFWTKRSKK